MDRLRIALIWPKGFDITYVMPLALGYLKSNVDESKFLVKIIDCSLDNYDSTSSRFVKELTDFRPDLVGVSCWSPTFIEAISILKVAKSIDPEITTLIGGSHASSYCGDVMTNKEVDFLFRGEADLSFQVFLEEFQKEEPDWAAVKGLMYKSSSGEFLMNDMERKDDLDVIKFPDPDSLRIDEYIHRGYRWNTPIRRNAPLWVTRGCPYRCTFCAAPMLNGRPIRTHSVEYMVEWVKYLYYEKNVKWFNIIDDNFTLNVQYAISFCEAMIDLDLDIGFGTPNGIRLQKGDPRLWELMKRAGWRSLNVAPESGSQRVLDIMKKDLKIEIVPDVVREIKEAGLKVQAYFILGYPGEKWEDLKMTSNLIKNCKFDFVFLNNFQPLPGTPVYDELVAAGEIENGLLPQNYSDGSRAYNPPDLKDFNFPLFVLKTYLMMVLRDPRRILYMLQIFDTKMFLKKLIATCLRVFSPKTKQAYFMENSLTLPKHFPSTHK